MENAIFIANRRRLTSVPAGYDRLYFGIEFCERLLPSEDDLAAAWEFARKNQLRFTFVTPFVTDAGLARIGDLVNALEAIAPETEIVINDWGVLNFLHERAWRGELALGRLLTKQKRGPQILDVINSLPRAALEHFRQNCSDSIPSSELLNDFGISRLELDNLLQGISRPRPVFPGSLYFPYAYVTTTRYCLTAACENNPSSYRSIGRCQRECQKYDFILTHKSMPVPLLLKGNTQFFKNEKLPSDLETLNINRLVFQPSLPL